MTVPVVVVTDFAGPAAVVVLRRDLVVARLSFESLVLVLVRFEPAIGPSAAAAVAAAVEFVLAAGY